MRIGATLLLQRALAGGHHAVSGEKPHFGRFLQGILCSAPSVLATVAACLWLFGRSFLPQLGCPLHPHPLEEHGCFSSFLRWELPAPGKARGRFLAVASESSSAFTVLRTWRGHGAARNESPQQAKGQLVLKA